MGWPCGTQGRQAFSQSSPLWIADKNTLCTGVKPEYIGAEGTEKSWWVEDKLPSQFRLWARIIRPAFQLKEITYGKSGVSHLQTFTIKHTFLHETSKHWTCWTPYFSHIIFPKFSVTHVSLISRYSIETIDYNTRRPMSLTCYHLQSCSNHGGKSSSTASILGTLSNDDDDGSENVAKKMNLRSFKLNRVDLDPFNMSNSAGDFSWSWIRKDFKFKKSKENSSSYVHVLHKTSN